AKSPKPCRVRSAGSASMIKAVLAPPNAAGASHNQLAAPCVSRPTARLTMVRPRRRGMSRRRSACVRSLPASCGCALFHPEGANRIAVFDFLVEACLRLGIARIRQDRAVTESTRTALHASLEPADDLAARDLMRGKSPDIAGSLECQAAVAERRLDLRLRKLRAQIDIVTL